MTKKKGTLRQRMRISLGKYWPFRWYFRRKMKPSTRMWFELKDIFKRNGHKWCSAQVAAGHGYYGYKNAEGYFRQANSVDPSHDDDEWIPITTADKDIEVWNWSIVTEKKKVRE